MTEIHWTWRVARKLAGEVYRAQGMRRQPSARGEEQLEDPIFQLLCAFSRGCGPSESGDAVDFRVSDAKHLACMAARFAKLLPAWPAELWPTFDRLLRRAWWDFPAISMNPATPPEFYGYLAELAPPEPARVPALMLAACHGNGFLREKALRKLAATPDAAALPILALRIDDWVPEVSAAALEAWQVSVPLAAPER